MPGLRKLELLVVTINTGVGEDRNQERAERQSTERHCECHNSGVERLRGAAW